MAGGTGPGETEPGGGAGVEAWRLVKARWADTAFTGEGARIGGGRWNSPGVPVVYLAGSLALAELEVLVNLADARLIGSYVAFRVRIPERVIEGVAPASLPADWRRDPAPRSARAVGDRWVAEERSAVLRIPSAVVPAEPNYLVNPAHPDAGALEVEGPFDPLLDPRLQ